MQGGHILKCLKVDREKFTLHFFLQISTNQLLQKGSRKICKLDLMNVHNLIQLLDPSLSSRTPHSGFSLTAEVAIHIWLYHGVCFSVIICQIFIVDLGAAVMG